MRLQIPQRELSCRQRQQYGSRRVGYGETEQVALSGVTGIGHGEGEVRVPGDSIDPECSSALSRDRAGRRGGAVAKRAT